MKTIERNCKNCNKLFQAPIKEVKRGRGFFCCLSCACSFNAKKRAKEKNKPNVNCAYCGKKFYKNNSKKKISKSGLFFCCREHKDAAQRIGGIKEIQPPHYGAIEKNYRQIAFRKYGKSCADCGYNKHEQALEVHHIDGNRENNRAKNLKVLCRNCHAIAHLVKS